MPDITSVWNVAAGQADWALAGTDLLGGGDLATAVIISLFSDAKASADEVISDGSGDPRGWCDDPSPSGPSPSGPSGPSPSGAGEDYAIGSKLWLLARAKRIPTTLARAQDYAQQALQWMIDDGVVARVTVAASWGAGPTELDLVVMLYDQAGGVLASVSQSLWAGVS